MKPRSYIINEKGEEIKVKKKAVIYLGSFNEKGSHISHTLKVYITESPYHYNNRLLVKDMLLPFLYKNKPYCK